jgi:hypothetical protein
VTVTRSTPRARSASCGLWSRDLATGTAKLLRLDPRAPGAPGTVDAATGARGIAGPRWLVEHGVAFAKDDAGVVACFRARHDHETDERGLLVSDRVEVWQLDPDGAPRTALAAVEDPGGPTAVCSQILVAASRLALEPVRTAR